MSAQLLPVRVFLVAVLTGLLLLASGCRTSTDAQRDRAAAERSDRARETRLEQARGLHREGVSALEAGRYSDASELLEKTTKVDPQFGLAQNNLGVAYLEQGRLYEAARRFDVAARLLPERAEPLINLGLLLEDADRLDDAIERYREALQREVNEPHAVGSLARAKVRRGDDDGELMRLLHRLHDDARPAWRTWARDQISASLSEDEILDQGSRTKEPNGATSETGLEKPPGVCQAE